MRKPIKLYNALLLGLIFLASSCEEIFVTDISESEVIIIAPVDKLISTSSNIQFWWNEVEDADYYTVEIVRPSFDTILEIVLDSNVQGLKLQWTFNPGNYQWRIKAVNTAGSTQYKTYNFTIDSNYNLVNTKLIILNPAENYFIKASTISFDWLNSYNVEKYYFSLYDPSDELIINEQELSTDIYNFVDNTVIDSLIDGKYKWGIRGQNYLSTTNYTYSYFNLDRTLPSSPTFISPINNLISSSGKLNFQWGNGYDVNYSHDSLIVFLDTSANLRYISKKVIGNAYSDSLPNGTYFWKLKTIDKAGNSKSTSSFRKIIVN